MGVKWTTATIVKQYLKGCGTSLLDAEIETFINMNEGLIEGILKIPSTFVFDSTTTAPEFAIRKLVTILSALDIITATPESINTFTAIDTKVTTLMEMWNDLIERVNKPDFMDYITNAEG